MSTQGKIEWKLSQQSRVCHHRSSQYSYKSSCNWRGNIAFWKHTWIYPDAYTGLKNCHLRALYAVSPRAAKLALSSKAKHKNSLKIHECLQQERGHLKGKVFRLREMHWVSLTPFYYADDNYCWKVIDYERVCNVLGLLADFTPNKIICIANEILWSKT